jgi:uncharacterized protein (DUF697 family)
MPDEASKTVTDSTLEQVEPIVESPKYFGANKIVNKYILWAMGAGFLPVPWLDMAAVSGVQIKMLNDLSKYYDIKFSENTGKSIIASLIGSISAEYMTRSTITSWFKTIPVIGVIGSFSMPIYSGASTYAVGKVFIQHFESGGTFLDFDPQKVKDYFAKMYKQGIGFASNLAPGKS